MGVITPKNEGFGFPWNILIICTHTPWMYLVNSCFPQVTGLPYQGHVGFCGLGGAYPPAVSMEMFIFGL